MPFKIIIVGAGIAGLCAAVALRQAGHAVEIFEKSSFASEIGAALVITPNGARVLSRWGFSFSAAQAVRIDTWDVVQGDTLVPLAKVDLSHAERSFGASVWAVHRVDLHAELLRLATVDTESTIPVRIHLASEVVAATLDGTITLKDGSEHAADLIIAADGLHSQLKKVVLDQKFLAPTPTGLSAFRFLVDTKHLEKWPNIATTMKKKGPGATLLADTKEIGKERHIMWYSCRNGEVQNFVGIHPERTHSKEGNNDIKRAMLDEFSHFSPDVLEIIRQSSHVKCWPLFIHDPLSRWFKGRVVLIGDAVHPMLPFGGQGANSAIEDGGAIGHLFTNVQDPEMITARLRQFELARKTRASRVQILSSVRAGKEKDVEEELRRFADPPGSNVPTSMIERTIHDYSFDVFKKCDEVSQGLYAAA